MNGKSEKKSTIQLFESNIICVENIYSTLYFSPLQSKIEKLPSIMLSITTGKYVRSWQIQS